MNEQIEARYEELVDHYACDDDSLLVLSRMVAELEWEVLELKEDISDLHFDSMRDDLADRDEDYR